MRKNARPQKSRLKGHGTSILRIDFYIIDHKWYQSFWLEKDHAING